MLKTAIALWALTVASFAQEVQIKEVGPHHLQLQSINVVTDPGGGELLRTNNYVQIGNGLGRWSEATKGWVPSSEEIEIVDGGAAARKGYHQASFAKNANSLGSLIMVTPDGRELRSHILGIYYRNVETGQTVLISKLKNSEGLLFPPQHHCLCRRF